MTDLELLRQYVQTRSESAFADLVRRHIDWVHLAALRQVRQHQLAEDVTQAAFIALAQQAGKLLKSGRPLSPWLFQVTRCASLTALRSEARRRRHEQKAAAMKAESDQNLTPDDWDQLAPMLDELVAKLGKTDRHAVLLRFYERRSFAEVASAIGTTEEAARKRITRAVAQLREMYARRNVAIASSAALLAGLETYATQAASAALVTATTQTGIAAGQGAAVAGQLLTIAKGAMQMMVWAKLKVVAAGLLLAAAATGGGVVLSQAVSVPAAAVAAAATMSAAIVLEEDESKAPGKIQLARWDLVLNEQGAQFIREVIVPLPTASKGFDAYRCRGIDLRNALAEAFAAGGVERVGEMMEHAWDSGQTLGLSGPWGNTLVSRPNTRVGMAFDGTLSEAHTRTAANRIHLALQHDIPRVGINELTAGWQWRQYPGAVIACDTELAPGDAVAFLGAYAGASGEEYYGLAVWEAYSATDAEVRRMIAVRDARWWCFNGPAQVRQWSDIASVWKANGTSSKAAELEPFAVRLEDGKTARLVALTNPSRWPFCWWDPTGNPTTEYNGLVSFLAGDPPEGLHAILMLDNPPEEHVISSPVGRPRHQLVVNGKEYRQPYTDVVSVRIAEGEAAKGQYETGILVGPWKEIARMAAEDDITIGATNYRTYRASAFGSTSFLVHFDVSSPGEDEDVLVAISKGREAWRLHVNLALQRLRQPVLEDQPNFHGIPLSEVEYFRLMRRKRQYVTFSGFAAEPRVLPPAAATSEQTNAAEKRIADRAEQQRLQAILDSRQAWQQTAPDPSTPKGAFRALGCAVLAKDARAGEALLLASTPEARAVGKDFVAYLIARQEAYGLVARRFGEADIHGKLGDLLTDIDDDFRDARFEDLPDGSVKADGLILRRIADGEYRFDMDDFARQHGGQLNRYLSAIKKVPELLNASPKLTVEGLRADLRRTPTTQP